MKLNTQKFINGEEMHKKWMQDPEYRKEYEKLQPEFQVARQMIGARLKKKMSQADLAKKIGTGQAVISRLEGMNASPSLALLKRIAAALETKLTIHIS